MAFDRWEHFHHESDIGIRAYGVSLEKALEQAGHALTAVITLEPVAPDIEVAISLDSPDQEFLLVDWLNALIFEMATRLMLFSRFAVQLDGTRLSATIRGEPVNVKKHQPAVEVKGATLSELCVRQMPDGSWLAQCVVDV